MSQRLIEVLQYHSGQFAQITPFDLNRDPIAIINLTRTNPEVLKLDLSQKNSLGHYIDQVLAMHHAEVGIGGYNEDRYVYSGIEVFSKEKNRSIHLGIDIWAAADTPIYAPLDGKVHSFKNNNSSGDYGPTLILEHELGGVTFYTLYGHLSLESISNKHIGQQISKGKPIATLGAFEINVHWPPHLHFQIISDMGDHFGDFPGVAALEDRQRLLALCPDPNLILEVATLKRL